MDLFQPNNLSRDHPEFVAIHEPTLEAKIKTLLEQHYAITADVVDVYLVKGANVASQNFKLNCDEAEFFLKSKPANKLQQLTLEATRASELHSAGLPLPKVISTAEADLVCSHDEASWALYEFVSGSYFKGTGSELDSAAINFAKLTKASLAIIDRQDRSRLSQPTELEQLLSTGAIDSITVAAIRDLCRTHREYILSQLQEVQTHLQIDKLTELPMHLDYHPLNLLMMNGEVVCILDLEHLKNYPVQCGVGFAGYKLIRQALVDSELRGQEQINPSMVQRWLNGWQTYFPDFTFDSTDLRLGASYRVLVLLSYILSSQKQGDYRFNYDLEKQIHSLYEINAIFGSRVN